MKPEEFFRVEESEQFIFYRVPKMLFTDKRYQNVSADAKLLYGFLLDRMGLSAKNSWFNEDGIVFLYFTVEEAAQYLGCGREKAGKHFAELEKVKLIVRKKQGLGKPAKIFIHKFIADVGKSAFKKAENQTSGCLDFRCPDIPFSGSNNTDKNNIDFSDNNLSIRDETDAMVKEQIEYDILVIKFPTERAKLDEIVCLLSDTLLATKNSIRISGNDFPAQVVRARFRKLNNEHIEYVIDMLNKNTTEVRNVRAYLLAALYNAPTTIDNYYSALVNHDLYGR